MRKGGKCCRFVGICRFELVSTAAHEGKGLVWLLFMVMNSGRAWVERELKAL
jgi:hypothetical protein